MRCSIDRHFDRAFHAQIALRAGAVEVGRDLLFGSDAQDTQAAGRELVMVEHSVVAERLHGGLLWRVVYRLRRRVGLVTVTCCRTASRSTGAVASGDEALIAIPEPSSKPAGVCSRG